MAANNCKQASIGRYTHERNALSLVKGLGPITMQPIYQSNPQDQMFKINVVPNLYQKCHLLKGERSFSTMLLISWYSENYLEVSVELHDLSHTLLACN